LVGKPRESKEAGEKSLRIIMNTVDKVLITKLGTDNLQDLGIDGKL